MSDHLIRLLAGGKNYYWALRQSHEGGEDALRDEGIEVVSLPVPPHLTDKTH